MLEPLFWFAALTSRPSASQVYDEAASVICCP